MLVNARAPRAIRVDASKRSIGSSMPLKTLLVHVDDSAASERRVNAAARIAAEHGARLIGAYCVPRSEIIPSVASMMPDELVARQLLEGAAAQRKAEQRFHELTKPAGVTAEWRAPAGEPRLALLAHGRCSDLVVLGQPDPDDPYVQFASDLFATMLVGLGRPLLVVPYIGAVGTTGQRILVACDGGREASRAIGDAMPFLERAREVRILLGQRDDARNPAQARTGERLGAWLADHGVVAPRIEQDSPPPADVGDSLISRAADFSSDLIVMGGYGHSRVREFLLGGTTRSVLRTMTVPVLMSH
jgi:nucleotide-binding universal stress UspA family protein